MLWATTELYGTEEWALETQKIFVWVNPRSDLVMRIVENESCKRWVAVHVFSPPFKTTHSVYQPIHIYWFPREHRIYLVQLCGAASSFRAPRAAFWEQEVNQSLQWTDWLWWLPSGGSLRRPSNRISFDWSTGAAIACGPGSENQPLPSIWMAFLRKSKMTKCRWNSRKLTSSCKMYWLKFSVGEERENYVWIIQGWMWFTSEINTRRYNNLGHVKLFHDLLASLALVEYFILFM